MVQIVLLTSDLIINTEAFVTPTITRNVSNNQITVPYDYYNALYGKAVFQLQSLVFPPGQTRKKMSLNSFRGSFLQMTTEKFYNNHLLVKSTDGTVSKNYVFDPRYFNTVQDFIAYLNIMCDDLIFTYNDPSNVPPVVAPPDPAAAYWNNAVGKCEIQAKPTKSFDGKDWYIDFDTTSIGRPLGFQLGKTPVINSTTHSLISNDVCTKKSIGKIFMSLQVGSKSYTNSRTPLTYLVYTEGDSTVNAPAASLSFNVNKDFAQSITIDTSQFNQLVVSLYDEYHNIIQLHGNYSFVLDVE